MISTRIIAIISITVYIIGTIYWAIEDPNVRYEIKGAITALLFYRVYATFVRRRRAE